MRNYPNCCISTKVTSAKNYAKAKKKTWLYMPWLNVEFSIVLVNLIFDGVKALLTSKWWVNGKERYQLWKSLKEFNLNKSNERMQIALFYRNIKNASIGIKSKKTAFIAKGLVPRWSIVQPLVSYFICTTTSAAI